MKIETFCFGFTKRKHRLKGHFLWVENRRILLALFSVSRLFFFFLTKCNLITFLYAKLPWLGDLMGSCGLQVKLPPAHLSTTHGGRFKLSLFYW